MSKRVATSVLNHDNWNVEDEAEEAGSFQVASLSELQARKILKPKRKKVETTTPSNPFQLLNGLTNLPVGVSTPVPVMADAPTISTQLQISTEKSLPELQSQVIKAQNQNGNTIQPENQVSEVKTNKDSSTPVPVTLNMNGGTNLTETAPHSSDSSGKVAETCENKDTSNDNVSGSHDQEELDLPDFVDQSDDEPEPDSEPKEESDSEQVNLESD